MAACILSVLGSNAYPCSTVWLKRTGHCIEVENWAFQRSLAITVGCFTFQYEGVMELSVLQKWPLFSVRPGGDMWPCKWMLVQPQLSTYDREVCFKLSKTNNKRNPLKSNFFSCSVGFFPSCFSQHRLNQYQPVNLNSDSCRLRKHTGRRPWLVTQIRTRTIPEQVRWGCADTNNSSCLFLHVQTPGSGSV